jgi:putative tricarboxylic transport membrane protein
MKKANLSIALVFAGIGVWVIIESYRLGIQTLRDPGAGSFPLLLGIALCLLALALCIDFLKHSSRTDTWKEAEKIKNKINLKISVAVISFLIGYAALLEILGFLITSFFFMWGLFWIANPRRWLFVSGSAALVTGVAYIVFVVLCQVSFPAGIWR